MQQYFFVQNLIYFARTCYSSVLFAFNTGKIRT